MMKIGELAKQTGLAASRIRFYERVGLLKTVTRNANGYRAYPREAVTVLSLITTAQKAGFSLDELKTLLPSDLSSWDHSSLVGALQQKIRDIEELEIKLAESKKQLLEIEAEIKAKPDDMNCSDNARRVLSQFGLAASAESAENTESTAKKKS